MWKRFVYARWHGPQQKQQNNKIWRSVKDVTNGSIENVRTFQIIFLQNRKPNGIVLSVSIENA